MYRRFLIASLTISIGITFLRLMTEFDVLLCRNLATRSYLLERLDLVLQVPLREIICTSKCTNATSLGTDVVRG
jgi:hypothetical protein